MLLTPDILSEFITSQFISLWCILIFSYFPSVYNLVAKFVFTMSQLFYTLRNTKLSLTSINESISLTVFPFKLLWLPNILSYDFVWRLYKKFTDDMKLFMNVSRCNKNSIN
jgi:hypothetical protein